ncbi:MAG: NAD-dependent deacylase [Ignavibacteriae bacterium]|nr:NAD-dependent deacylase [Ignavibacteriota bacterium]
MDKPNIVILTGAGVSAESGISTFRDSGGLWENYDIMEVASIEGWYKNKKLVLDFYNQRRRQLKEVEPNAAHYAIAKLEEHFDVTLITQNVDNLHECAGSKNIIHLHGQLTQAKSTAHPGFVYEIGYDDINLGDKCEKGSQLRPNIVWFGEAVPMMYDAGQAVAKADIFIVVGTSLVVYPAAGLINSVKPSAYKYIIDPIKPQVYDSIRNIEFIEEIASAGTPKLADMLIEKYK